MRTFLLACIMFVAAGSVMQAQSRYDQINSIGLRFSTDLNYFQRPEQFQMVDHWFSTGIFGVFYRTYQKGIGAEIGLNVNAKGNGPSAFNLPVIMEDFLPSSIDPIVGMFALELDVKAGPRIDGLHLKPVGLLVGYRFVRDGFLIPGSELEVNPFYVKWPFGASFAFPTDWGAVSFGTYYELEITNVVKDPRSMGGVFLEGGRQHAINFEITVSYNSRN